MSADLIQNLKAHLAQCPECQEVFESLTRWSSRFQRETDPAEELSPSLREHIRLAVRQSMAENLAAGTAVVSDETIPGLPRVILKALRETTGKLAWQCQTIAGHWTRQSLALQLAPVRGQAPESVELDVIAFPSLRVGVLALSGESSHVDLILFLQANAPDHAPLVGQEVTWATPDGEGPKGQSDDSGRVEFYGLTPGRHTFRLSEQPEVVIDVEVVR